MDSKEIQRKSEINVNDFIKITKWVFKTIFTVNPKFVSLNITLSLFQSIRPTINTFILAKILDLIISLASGEAQDFNRIYPAVGLIILINMAFSGLGYFESYCARWIDITADTALRRLQYTKLKNLGIQTLQDPEINNQIHRTRVGSLLNYYRQTIDFLSNAASAIVSMIIVLKLQPLLVPIVILITIPRYLTDKSYRKEIWGFDIENTEGERKANRNANDLTTVGQLQEIFINNSFNFLDQKFTVFYNWYNKLAINMRKKGFLKLYLVQIMGDAVLTAGFIKIFFDFFKKFISVGDVYFQINTLQSLQRNVQNGFGTMNNLFEFSIKLKEVYELFHKEPSFADGKKIIPALTNGPGVELKNLSFAYPSNKKLVLKNINLKIKSGEKIAIVGPNGAGKTTLVRLLTKMYLPTKGKILLDKFDISKLSAESLHQNMGVLFQDFNTYPHLTVTENIYLGDPTKPLDMERVLDAAKSADAYNFIDQLPDKFDQTLSEIYKGGIKLSTGQWQKIAIARFFYRNAPLVIFDEPTASIDAESEYNIFNKIYSFFENKTVIIISHRFSTVRNADKIIVLRDGKIQESGSHLELLELGGEYERAFMLQAKGYSIDKVESIA